MTDKDVQRDSPRRKADSQLIESELPTMRNHPTGHENEPRNGVLIVHQNESSEEHLRRLKGKAIMTDNQANTSTPLAKGHTIPG